MKRAGHKHFVTQTIDLSKDSLIDSKLFDGIIADVPCSGSGTWTRSPEWLLNDSISSRLSSIFVPLQRKIVSNLIPHLKSGRPLIYITCSAFLQENEENVAFFEEHLPLKLEKSAYIEGYRSKADTLFVSRFVRND
jgi:16S rRNA (cytosine967-C5)-methyltransferase